MEKELTEDIYRIQHMERNAYKDFIASHKSVAQALDWLCCDSDDEMEYQKMWVSISGKSTRKFTPKYKIRIAQSEDETPGKKRFANTSQASLETDAVGLTLFAIMSIIFLNYCTRF